MKPERVVAFVGDTHVGSRVGLWPEGVYTPQGQLIPPSKFQLQILENFHNFCDLCDRHHVDTVIFTGDLLNGKNPAESGQHQMEADINFQKNVCSQALFRIIQNRKVLGVAGTEYHDARNGKLEQALIEEMNGKWLGPMANLTLEGTRLTMNVCHGTGGSPVYDASLAEANIKEALIAEACNKMPHIDLFVRGHLHIFFYLQKINSGWLQVPCWQDFAPYKGIMRKIGKFQPDIGGCIVHFYRDEYFVFKKLYPNPKVYQRSLQA